MLPVRSQGTYLTYAGVRFFCAGDNVFVPSSGTSLKIKPNQHTTSRKMGYAEKKDAGQ